MREEHLRAALEEIRDIANCSEGVEFYAMLADKALEEDDAMIENRVYKLVGHILRWFLELVIIWDFVYDETGLWTCIALTMITVGIEFDHLDFRLFKKNAPVK